MSNITQLQTAREAIGNVDLSDSPALKAVVARREAAAIAEADSSQHGDAPDYLTLDGVIYQKVETVAELRAGYLVADRSNVNDVVEHNTLVQVTRA